MPLPLAHGLVGASVVAALHPQPSSKRYAIPLLVGALSANSPDLDFLLVWIFHSKAWHRAFTHSFFFALIVSSINLALLGRARVREAVAYGLAFMSHGVLDYVTTKVGGGVELLWPVSTERLKLGLLGLSEVPSQLPAIDVLKACLVETAIFALMLITVLVIRRGLSR